METAPELVRSRDIRTPEGIFSVTVHREDFSGLYPGLVRYTVRLLLQDRVLSLFATNTYEYTPLMPLEAERVALALSGRWEHDLEMHPQEFLAGLPAPGAFRISPFQHGRILQAGSSPQVVIIQGSPRSDGNCGIMAGWAASAARKAGRTVQVIYPQDMDIRPCTGCYQCYNTGTCSIDDQMTGIIQAFRESSLVVICSPVYTNTVPAALKLVIDRSLAYHAERQLTGAKNRPAGILLAAAGRKGLDNFACVQSVVHAFMGSTGIRKAGEILVDDLDVRRDVRGIPGIEDQVKNLIFSCLAAGD